MRLSLPSSELSLMLRLSALSLPSRRPISRCSNRGARLLHLARRAERTLLSYERSGWLDDEPSRVTQTTEAREAHACYLCIFLRAASVALVVLERLWEHCLIMTMA